MGSQFFLVHHYVKPGKAGQWWQKTGELMSDQPAMGKYVQDCMGLGFYNHSFMPVHKKARCFVYGKRRREFQKLISKTLLMAQWDQIGG